MGIGPDATCKDRVRVLMWGSWMVLKWRVRVGGGPALAGLTPKPDTRSLCWLGDSDLMAGSSLVSETDLWKVEPRIGTPDLNEGLDANSGFFGEGDLL